jgi:hypothetical protein
MGSTRSKQFDRGSKKVLAWWDGRLPASCAGLELSSAPRPTGISISMTYKKKEHNMSVSQEITLPMPFIKDPKAIRVVDPESGNSLMKYVRDVPAGESWFRFVFNGIDFLAKARSSWTDSDENVTFTFQVSQLENSLRFSHSLGNPRYEPSQEEFRAAVLPALSDAVDALMHHVIDRRGGQPQFTVEVKFVDREPSGPSGLS